MLSKNESKLEADRIRKKLKMLPDEEITCEYCEYNDNCEFVWDLYNTHGDCLALK